MTKNKETQTATTLWGISPGVSAWLDVEAENPNDWLVDRLIYRGTICMLDGLGGTGKSYIALQLAISIATGLPFLGLLPAQQGRVIILNGEDPEAITHSRFRRIAESYVREIGEKEMYEAARRITHVSMTSVEASSVLIDERMQPTQTYAELKQFCDAWKPDLIIFDPLSFFLAKENDNSYAAQFYIALRKLKSTILFLHHFNKSGMNGEGEERTKSRGASVFVENTRTHITLKNGVLSVEKNNYHKPFNMDLEFEGGMWCATKINTEAIEEQPKPKRKPIRFMRGNNERP